MAIDPITRLNIRVAHLEALVACMLDAMPNGSAARAAWDMFAMSAVANGEHSTLSEEALDAYRAAVPAIARTLDKAREFNRGPARM